MLEPMERVRALLVFAAGTVVAICWLALVSDNGKPTLLLHNTPPAESTTSTLHERP